MKLSLLLAAIGINLKAEDKEISFITDNSRNVKENTLFVCHKNGEGFLNEALSKGAAAVIGEEELFENMYISEDTRKAYNILCRKFWGNPEKEIKIIAVTGTNGKTSVSALLSHILNLNGHKTGLIGTAFADKEESTMTTPEPFELFSRLSRMTEKGYEYCVIEASSQGLIQKRLYGIEFEAGIFTNLTEDHLDYHKTFDNYKNAKLLLFESCKKAIINFDDRYKDEFINASKGRVITYSVCDDKADFTARGVRYLPESTTYELVSDSLIHRISLKTKGDFWVANSLAATVCAYECGVEIEKCAFSLKSFSGVKGRMEIVPADKDFTVIIDYAHTADGLQKALLSLRRFCRGRLILVFGCGGDREKEKRRVMGQVATTYADRVFVTSDNPRTEDEDGIIDDILEGISSKKKTPVYIQPDRKKAIEAAFKSAKKGDIILLAGKGHETYQIKGNEMLPFDERSIIKSLLAETDKNDLPD